MAARVSNAIRKRNVLKGFQKNSVFVYGLNWRTGREQISEYFEKFGRVDNVYVHMNQYRGISKGFAHLKFRDEQSLSAALTDPNHVIDGHPVNIKMHEGPAREAMDASS